MKFALCNEVLAELPFPAQCDMAAKLGYMGLEVAPFTLGENPHLMRDADIADLRRAASDAGIVITGLHWLLITPKGLSITTADETLRKQTGDVLERLVGLCAALGGSVLVHGSPLQRSVPLGEGWETARARAVELFHRVAKAAADAAVTYCLEPLAPRETNFINTVEEAASIVDEIANSAFRTMIDTSAAGNIEALPVPDLIDAWLQTGKIAHIQVNDRNRRAPGQGGDRFRPVLQALNRNQYDGVVAVEPFEYIPDGLTTAAQAIGYLRGCLEPE